MLLDFLLPSPCIQCSKVGAAICLDCVEQLNLKAKTSSLTGIPLVYFSEYQDVSKIVNAIKENGLTSLIPAIAKAMAQTWPDEYRNKVLVPIPSSPANAKKRGFSHTGLFARAVARQVGQVQVRELLVSARGRVDQVNLNSVQRQENMIQAFRLSAGAKPGLQVVLFDDVCTSGASLTEAARTLQSGGFTVTGFCVFARVLGPNGLF